MKLQLKYILLIFFLLLVLYYLSNCNSVCGIDSINGFSVGGKQNKFKRLKQKLKRLEQELKRLKKLKKNKKRYKN